MPWGWECKARLVKQTTLKPTQKRPTKWDDFILPGPAHYPPPEIFCGRGFSKIRRAPAYSFGLYTPVRYTKPAAVPNAPTFNICGLSRKGVHKVPQGIMGIQFQMIGDKTQKPGPGAHAPKNRACFKRPPAYSMRIAAKPNYEPWDMWTPPPNMYLPPIPGKKYPAYTFGDPYKPKRDDNIPGPGQYDPKLDAAKKAPPAFSLGARVKPPGLPTKVPAPNTYCEKRFLYSKPSAPAPSFGIRHSPFLGKSHAYEMPSRLEQLAKDLA